VATSVPSLIRMTVGTSALLTNQSVLDATVPGWDQAAPDRSANFSVKVASRCSIQLRIRPRCDMVICGCEVTPLAGSVRGSSLIAHADCCGAATGAVVPAGDPPPRHDELRTTASRLHPIDRRIDSPVKRAYPRMLV
jgi:hypothetical protein